MGLPNTVNMVYEQMIRDEAAREAEKGPRKPHHYPSEACAMVDGKFEGRCRRATWLSWKGVPKTNPMDAPALFKVRAGDLIHQALNSAMARALAAQGYVPAPVEEWLGEEVEFQWTAPGLRYEYSGRMDNLFRHGDGLVRAEWKSTYGRGADFIKRDGPKMENLLQCKVYLKQDAVPALEGIVLMYAARDSGFLFGYWVYDDPAGLLVESMNSSRRQVVPVTLDGIVAATSMLEEYLDGDVPPPCDFVKDRDWQCDYCSWRKHCDKNP